MVLMKRLAPLFLLLLVSACTVRDAACGRPVPEGAQAQPTATPASAVDPQSGTPFTIVYLGDSLTAGLGLLSEQAFPSLIEKQLHEAGYVNVDTINAGIYLLDAELLGRIPTERAVSIEREVFPALIADGIACFAWSWLARVVQPCLSSVSWRSK